MGTEKKKPRKYETGEFSPVAIVGMAGIFPEAENLERYWTNILQEVDCIREVPASRWAIEDYYDPDPNAPDKSYNKHGGFIPDIQFDPMEFGLPPNFLEVTDVSQLLGLVVARDALSDAGYPEKGKEIFDRTGVILGMVGMSSKIIHPLLNRLQYPVWEKVLRASSVPEPEIPQIIEKMKTAYIGWNENAFPGAIGNVVAGRIANRFDLGGTNCIVDAACGSSLAAVSMAVSELALGRADMMITGGVDTDNSILTYLCFSKTPAFSRGDKLRAFSADSDGMLVGEGVGMLVLKRLADAEKDNDRIYAVIRGVGTSSDGYFKSIYAPRPSGQAKAIKRAYDCAGFSSQSVGLIEAHGTGTMAGDPAEFEGLLEVFGREDTKNQHIALGSVKSQIGHTKATAGTASMIKAALSLHHKVLPATINVSKPHPGMEIEQTPFYLNTHTRPWFRRTDGGPRRAGVSSFGFGGTNFHIAVEEYSNEKQEFTRVQPAPFTILLSAPTPEALMDVCRVTAADLAGGQAIEILNRLDEASDTGAVPADHARLGFLAVSGEEAREKLAEAITLLENNQGQQSWSHPKGIFFRSEGMDTKGKTAALFPGQGSQYVNMGLELAINFPAFREVFEKADSRAVETGRDPLTNTAYPIPVFTDEERKTQQDKLTATENAQPAIGTFSMGIYQMLQSAGFQADFFAGHSFGELTALWAGGFLDDDAYIRLASARGQAMGTPAASGKDTGSMAAVKGDIDQISGLIKDVPEVRIANFNTPSQVVLAGSSQGIKDIQPVLENAGFKVYPLNVSAAFHTPFVGHAQEPFSEAIKKEKICKPKGKVYSNTTAQPYPQDAASVVQTLSDHILNPVRFHEEIMNIYNDGGRIFIEIGPKNVLTNLVKDILGDKPHEMITFNPNAKGDSDLQFRQAVLQMRVQGFVLGTINPHKTRKETKTAAASKVAVMLNGGLYTTEATRQKFEQVLKEKPVSARMAPKMDEQPELPVETNNGNTKKAGSLNQQHGTRETVQMTNNHEVENLIGKLQEHQSDVLKVHERFLQNDGTSKNLLHQITNNQLSMLSGTNGRQLEERAISMMEKQAEQITNQHEVTSDAHRAYIQSQTDFMRQYAELVQGLQRGAPSAYPAAQPGNNGDESYKPVPDLPAEKTAPVEAPQAGPQGLPAEPAMNVQQAFDPGELSASFLAIVSEKTGYPTEMLEMSMDMEADLGIDSIKRVEILGAMQEKYPELPTIQAEELVELRTLAQVIGAFKTDSHPAANPPAVEAPANAGPGASPPVLKSASADSGEIQKAFLEIVSEKTGYPTDMLELSMDMEADLGIDSIKRVEILGAMQEKYPELPTIDAEQLIELRTLAQVTGAFESDLPAQEKPQPAEEPADRQESNERKGLDSQIGESEIKASFLEIVSEKTGYPTEMLEMDMDMEADLGIDSIKRVEILGATQEKFPNLPTIEADELIELRTLGQIIARFSGGGRAAGETGSNDNHSAQTEKSPALKAVPVTARPLPKPDRAVFDFPEGSTMLITDGDTEKADKLAKEFTGKGLQVGIIRLNPNGKPPEERGRKYYPLEDASENGIETLMKQVVREHKEISGFIHMEAAGNGKSEEPIEISDEGMKSLKTVFLMARHLKTPLAATADKTRPAFFTVTQMDGQFGLKDCETGDPLPGGFSGLAKTLRQEWNSVFCRALDFDPAMEAQEVAEKINDELFDADLRLGEVGYTNEGRFTIAIDDVN